MYDISSIKRATKTFLEVSRYSRTKQRQRNVQKIVCYTCKVAFLVIRPIVVFHLSPALPSPLSITRFHILFEQTIILSRASLLALAISVYYYIYILVRGFCCLELAIKKKTSIDRCTACNKPLLSSLCPLSPQKVFHIIFSIYCRFYSNIVLKVLKAVS